MTQAAPFPSSSPPGLTRWSMLTRSESNTAGRLNKPASRMDCRVKPGNDEREIVLATHPRPSSAYDHTTKKHSPPAKRGRRSAERRMPTMSAQHRQTLPLVDALSAAAHHFRRRARLPALHRGTRHRLSPRWLSPRTGFPQDTAHGVFCPFAASEARSVRTGPFAGRPVPQSRPGADRIHPRAGTAPRSVFRKCPRERRPQMSRVRLM
jgi:hypothetical protein